MNNNNNNLYEIKCNIHLNQEIEFICSDCLVPICKLCMVGGGDHYRHSIDLISLDNSTLIFNEFKSNRIKNLKDCLNGDKEIQDKSNDIYNKIEAQHVIDLELVKNEFNELHKILDIVEKDITRQLITCLDENYDVSIKIKQLLDEKRKTIDLILNKHKDLIDTYNIDQIFNNNKQLNIELLKYSQKSQILLNNLENNQNDKLLEEFKQTLLTHSMDTIKELVKDSFKIELQSFINPVPNTIEIRDIKFNVHKDGEPYGIILTMGPHNKIELKVGSLPNIITTMVLMDGFEQSLEPGVLPFSIQNLYLGNIKSKLVKNSIPNSVRNLYLMDGFNQSLKPGIIPQSIQNLYIGNIKSNLVKNSIPKNIMSLYFMDGFNQKLPNDIFEGCSLNLMCCGDTTFEMPIFTPRYLFGTPIYIPITFNQKYRFNTLEKREWGNSLLKITNIK